VVEGTVAKVGFTWESIILKGSILPKIIYLHKIKKVCFLNFDYQGEKVSIFHDIPTLFSHSHTDLIIYHQKSSSSSF